jgi:Tfp pilus assembly protein PilW
MTSHTPPVDCASRSDGAAGFSLVELLVTLMVMLAVLGVVTQVVARTSVASAQQRAHLDRRQNTVATTEMIVRLLRQATMVHPDPDGNGVLDSIRIRADWNPRDGDWNPIPETVPVDPYEDITFTVVGNTLFKEEPDFDAAPVAFADDVNTLQFAYFTPAGGAVPNPMAVTQGQLAFVRFTVGTTALDGQPGITITSSASIRRLE